jgi:hypothetical protein
MATKSKMIASTIAVKLTQPMVIGLLEGSFRKKLIVITSTNVVKLTQPTVTGLVE